MKGVESVENVKSVNGMKGSRAYDVIVVGAGPAGLYSTRLLEKRFNVLVLEEDKEIGKPIQCSGLVSKNLDNFVKVDGDCIENEIKGAIFHSKNSEFRLEKSASIARVIDRNRFDSSLARGLKSNILTGTMVTGIEIGEDGVKVKAEPGGKEFVSRMVLGCDGPNSIVRNHFGVRPAEIIRGLIAITKEKDSSGLVELWFDKELLDDGFFWKIPRGESVEYGMLSKDADFAKLEKFFTSKLKGKSYERRAGMIPIGIQKTYFPRTLLVGDSACQVKPWSGGGVVYGMICAGIASDVVSKAFGSKDFSEDFLKQYEDRWKKEIGRSITMGLMFREFLKDIDNQGIEKIFDKIKKKGIDNLNMDFPFASFQ